MQRRTLSTLIFFESKLQSKFLWPWFLKLIEPQRFPLVPSNYFLAFSIGKTLNFVMVEKNRPFQFSYSFLKFQILLALVSKIKLNFKGSNGFFVGFKFSFVTLNTTRKTIEI